MKKYTIVLLSLLLIATSKANTIIDLGWSNGEPSNIPSELNRLNTQINNYNNFHNPDLDSAVGWLGTKTETPTGPTSITLDLKGFDGYLLFKWGNIDRFYFINDLVIGNYSPSTVIYNGNGSYTFLSDVTPHSNSVMEISLSILKPRENYLGLSHYTEFVAPVPESTTIFAGALLFFPLLFNFVKRKN